jgi:hypothetical protein
MIEALCRPAGSTLESCHVVRRAAAELSEHMVPSGKFNVRPIGSKGSSGSRRRAAYRVARVCERSTLPKDDFNGAARDVMIQKLKLPMPTGDYIKRTVAKETFHLSWLRYLARRFGSRWKP